MKRPTRILIVATGHAAPPIAKKFGDFDRMFVNDLASTSDHLCETATYAICDAESTSGAPKPEEFDGVIITGSASMVSDAQPWIQSTIKLAHHCLEQNTPLLGVCFGHQILALAVGAKVGPNPKGRNAGTDWIKHYAENDPLLINVPKVFPAQVSHRDVILESSSQLNVIGKSKHDSHHIIKVGDTAWGVQFHPEWSVKVSREYLKLRMEMLINDLGKEKFDQLYSSLTETPSAGLVLKNFLKFCTAQAG